MADITLRVNGDAGGGVAAMDSMGDAVGKSAVKWQEMANAAKFAATQVAAFAVDSLKKYAESERVLRQLQRATGDYSTAIDEQSKALSRLYAVDDDLINQSATLLAQWGGVGAATKDVETAALNLASAMGTDLRSATTDLIRNVESGGTGLAKMGIHFEATGDKGHDLEAAVAAINKKLGGSAAADADSLIGRTHAAELAFEDLQKSLGGMLNTALDKTGALDFLANRLREITKGAEVAFAVFSRLPSILGGVVRGNIAVQTATDEIANIATAAFLGGNALETGALPAVAGKTNKGRKDAASGKTQAEMDDASLEAAKKYQRGLDEIEAHADERASAASDRVWATVEDEEKARQKMQQSALDFDKKIAKEEDDRRLKTEQEAAQLKEKALKDSDDRTAKKVKEAQAAGDAIGAAMVNALADQLSKLAEGGEFDAALFIGDILAAAVGVAGTVIGTAFGAPAVGAAIGNLAAMGIRAGSSAISRGAKSNKPRTYHDGGWVGDEPRHHSGAWIGADEQRAILQTGERVLSRREVGAMGGSASVDSSARGSGGRPIYIQAIDSKSMADTFSDRGGDGLKQALRRGHGALPAIFGRGPR